MSHRHYALSEEAFRLQLKLKVTLPPDEASLPAAPLDELVEAGHAFRQDGGVGLTSVGSADAQGEIDRQLTTLLAEISEEPRRIQRLDNGDLSIGDAVVWPEVWTVGKAEGLVTAATVVGDDGGHDVARPTEKGLKSLRSFTYSYFRPDGNGLGSIIVMQRGEEIWHLTEQAHVGLDRSPTGHPPGDRPDKLYRVERITEEGALVSLTDAGPLEANEATPVVPAFSSGDVVTVFWGPIPGETVDRHDFEVIAVTPDGLLLRPPGVNSIPIA